MATDKSDKTPQPAQAAVVQPAAPVAGVLLSPAQHAAQQLAAELADMREKGIKPDEAQPGGYFIGDDGKPHDAHGNRLEGGPKQRPKSGFPRGGDPGAPGRPAGQAAGVHGVGFSTPAAPSTGASSPTPSAPGTVDSDELPDDFPARDALTKGGFKTLSAVRAASDEELDALDGVGPATLEKIRDAQKG
jgi:hypothetical protein